MSRSFNPKVSIIIPVYNGSNYLKEAIDSALAQTYKNIEIIVINDGSNDKGKTDKTCKSYGKRIRYFKKENGGVSSALNMGIEKMEGEYFSWLSHDDVYYPEKIEMQVEELSKLRNKKVILYSNVEYIDEHSKLIYRTEYEKKYSNKDLNIGIFPVLKGLSNGCALLIPKICFEESGLFNENLRTSNDYDMWFRLFRKYEIKFIPEVLIKYRLHDKQGTKIEPSYLEESNRLWSSIISDLKEKEILKFEDSLFDFYYKMAKQMEESNFQKAYKVANTFAKKQYLSRTPRVSVIMPCYNTEKYLAEAIESILEQTFCDFELIIVDDSSTDKSPQIIRQYKKKDYRIVSVSNKNKKGISGAMNTGIDLTRGEYLVRMDSDDISLSDRLKKQVEFLDKNQKYGICSVNISLFGLTESPMLFKKRDAPLEWLLFWENPIANATIMYRRSIIEKNNLRFGDYELAEDYDFLSRVVLFTRPFALEEVLYKYRIHSRSIFQRKGDQAKLNSLEISNSFANNVTQTEVPLFHQKLTNFYENDATDKDLNVINISLWLNKLLENSKELWKWTKEEYYEAAKDANKRIKRYLASNMENDLIDEIKSLRKDVIWLQWEKKNHYKEISRLREKLLMYGYKVENEDLNLIGKGKKLIYLIKTQGIVVTARNLLIKAKDRIMKN